MKLMYKRSSALALFLLVMVAFSRAQVTFNLPTNAALVNITKAEYFFDTDPGPGLATALTVNPATNTTISNASISISGLANGVHRFFTRTADANGHWSLTNEEPFFIVSPVAFPANAALPDVVKAEYFFDTDPGLGLGNPILVTPGTNTTVSNYSMNIQALSKGIHRIYIRTENAAGRWSLTNEQALFIVSPVAFPSNPALPDVTKAEYFFDTDPGIGSATPITVTSPGTNTTINAVIPVAGLSTTMVHRLYLRTADGNGRWSLTNIGTLAVITTGPTIPSNPTPGNITLLEYFFDTDPGFGNGTTVALTPTTNLAGYSFPVDVSSLSQGSHTLFVRVFDGWSQTSAMPLSVGTDLPVTLLSFTATLESGGKTLLNWVTTNETNNQYFAVERSGNGATYDSIGMVPGAGTTNVQQRYSFTDAAPLNGMNYYRLKQVDVNGNMTYSPIVTVRLQASIAFSVAPNPTHDLLTVDLGTAPAATGVFRIVDMQGRIVLVVNTTTSAVQQLNVSGLAPGAYILQYLTETNSTTVRFIKF